MPTIDSMNQQAISNPKLHFGTVVIAAFASNFLSVRSDLLLFYMPPTKKSRNVTKRLMFLKRYHVPPGSSWYE